MVESAIAALAYAQQSMTALLAGAVTVLVVSSATPVSMRRDAFRVLPVPQSLTLPCANVASVGPARTALSLELHFACRITHPVLLTFSATSEGLVRGARSGSD